MSAISGSGDDFELPIDIPTPFSLNESINSKSSAKPAPLNFSRPRIFLHPEPLTVVKSSKTTARTPDAPAPAPPAFSSSHPGDLRPDEEDTDESEDEAAPPPVIRTHANTAESAYYKSRSNSTTWIYKPYTNHGSSRSGASSHISQATNDVDARDDASIVESTTDSVAESTSTGYSSVTDFAFDGQLGWNTRPASQAEIERQRWHGPPVASLGSSTRNLSSVGEENTWRKPSTSSLLPIRSSGNGRPFSSSGSDSTGKSAPAIPPRQPRIIKRISMDQVSEHLDHRDGDGSSDSASLSSSEWKSSEYDTSCLTVEQIHKLKKKGVNPSLYAEMKQARKGKGGKLRIGPLTGNTFLG